MEFCPTCEKRMVLQRTKDGAVYICPVCKCKKSTTKPSAAKTVVPKKTREKIVVIGKKEQNIKTNPTTNIKCPKCENNLAYTWQVQTRSGDEGATQFFRCTK
ncbi:MAG: RPA12/RPB9/RPC11 RNA polymerase family protein, partial [Candidatus Bathyarchaeota archaeon]|nr:RPA12/RPB9/RPC11 RNA polymerase family protein [Candidatus Bathyarchaeota archaeon]